MHSIAIFGGAFDPVHNGHLQASITIQNHFKFDSYIFLPCKTPTIKPPTLASNDQRIEMLKRAINNLSDFKLDLREIERDTPSYMVETLNSFREEYPDSSITLIIGYDAFLSLPNWYQWEKIITLANLLVINRSEFAKHPVSEIVKNFLHKHKINDKDELLTTQSGKVFLFDAGNYEISSTALREDIKKGANVNNRLPCKVYEYIKSQGLYR
ncbi:nicotinate-nucleotide adenylyltransferase [Fluoribacter dumoffii]|uniref:nicotinate-nucleotide adenylyltransferase n=1 Tax=Fluoribacter dumoffii TaxID=463 RepID=UPI0022437E37|nr:nicotinate-nucleotide adenylyltransferase [Fluoribacter dumoffii]MCW8418404.1 nicotinate-nucleotide adenylyltransferase [Fluoribacter dumoffii]MCW8453754.1 nicotinate-nucleotide adenylyltransferase [Fluoribacter dumoffii]MCW8462175.1 nicotinate-nucleotide adenylyltransferase [Fluoribacter dumoffii]MCW8482387.1 nicotinate-nucleotide adenylyltransferase [Fluoribacter dumoffii]